MSHSHALLILHAAGSYVLVVKREKGGHSNFKIRTNSAGFFIDDKASFVSIAKLIEHYKTSEDLGVVLGKPIDRHKTEERSRDKWEANRDTIAKTREIGSGSFGEVTIKGAFLMFLPNF